MICKCISEGHGLSGTSETTETSETAERKVHRGGALFQEHYGGLGCLVADR